MCIFVYPIPASARVLEFSLAGEGEEKHHENRRSDREMLRRAASLCRMKTKSKKLGDRRGRVCVCVCVTHKEEADAIV